VYDDENNEPLREMEAGLIHEFLQRIRWWKWCVFNWNGSGM